MSCDLPPQKKTGKTPKNSTHETRGTPPVPCHISLSDPMALGCSAFFSLENHLPIGSWVPMDLLQKKIPPFLGLVDENL